MPFAVKSKIPSEKTYTHPDPALLERIDGGRRLYLYTHSPTPAELQGRMRKGAAVRIDQSWLQGSCFCFWQTLERFLTRSLPAKYTLFFCSWSRCCSWSFLSGTGALRTCLAIRGFGACNRIGGGGVQSLGRVRLCDPLNCSTRQASLSLTISRSLPKFISIESVMPSNHLILYRCLLLLPSIFPSIRVSSNESTLIGLAHV